MWLARVLAIQLKLCSASHLLFSFLIVSLIILGSEQSLGARKGQVRPSVVLLACSPSTQEEEAVELRSRPAHVKRDPDSKHKREGERERHCKDKLDTWAPAVLFCWFTFREDVSANCCVFGY